MQKRLLANGVLVSNGRLKGPEDGHSELPGRHRAALNGIRLGACASSLPQGRRWETARLPPGRPLAESGEQKPRTGRGGRGRRKPWDLGLVPPVVGIRGHEQNHLRDICEGSRALKMPTERQEKSFIHSFIPQSLLQACWVAMVPREAERPTQKGEATDTNWLGISWVRRAVSGPAGENRGQDILWQDSPQGPGWP